MADIDVERKNGGMGWLWGLLALVAVALIVWWVWPDDEPEPMDTEIEAVEPVSPTTPESVGPGADVSIGDILGNPDSFIGDTFPQSEVTVTEVPTDRGFWIEDEGQRLFVIVNDQPQEQRVDINPGQTLRIDGGMLRDRTFLPQVGGSALDEDTESIAGEQEVFLVVDEEFITILEGGEPQPGTDPAQGVGEGTN